MRLLTNPGNLSKLTEQQPALMSQRNLAAMQGAASRSGSSASRAPSLSRGRPRWRILLRRRWQRLAHRLRPDLGADRFQGLDAGRHKVAVAINEAVQLPEQGRGFFVVQDLDDDYSRR